MKIKLTAWAAKHYDPAPPIYTLRRWAREGEIVPQAELVGKEYYVDENARRLSVPAPSLVERLSA
jgi:predicted site-specific integrase-resolvase